MRQEILLEKDTYCTKIFKNDTNVFLITTILVSINNLFYTNH